MPKTLETKTRFGQLLRLYREGRDWSQDELATLVGTSGASISRYETGQFKPSFEAALRLADGFGLTGQARIDFFREAGFDVLAVAA